MLKIEIVENKKNLLRIKISVPRRASINEEVHSYNQESIKKQIDLKIKEDFPNISSYEILGRVSFISNKMSQHPHSQILNLKIAQKVKKKLNQKVKPVESSGSSKS